MVGLAKAQNCTESGWLLIQMYIASVPEWQVFDEAGETTAIRVIRVPSVGSGKVQVTCDGISYEYWEITGANEIRIQIQNPDCVLKVFTGDCCLMLLLSSLLPLFCLDSASLTINNVNACCH